MLDGRELKRRTTLTLLELHPVNFKWVAQPLWAFRPLPHLWSLPAVSHVKENIQTFNVRVFSVMRAAPAVPHLPWSAQAAIMNCHRLGVLNHRHFSLLWGLGSPRPRCQQIQCLVRTLFLVCRQLPSGHVLASWTERVLISFSSYKGTNPITGIYSHLNSSTSPTPHLLIPSRGRLGFQHMNMGRGT